MGYTANCRRCLQLRAGRPAAGKAHTPECRARLEAAMAEAGDARSEAAETRIVERIVEQFPEPPSATAAASSSSSGAGDLAPS